MGEERKNLERESFETWYLRNRRVIKNKKLAEAFEGRKESKLVGVRSEEEKTVHPGENVIPRVGRARKLLAKRE